MTNCMCRGGMPLYTFCTSNFGLLMPSPHPSPGGIGIYTTFLHSKNNRLQHHQAPSPAGEGWGEENKINWLYSPSSQPSPSREKGPHLCRYLCPRGEGGFYDSLQRARKFMCRNLMCDDYKIPVNTIMLSRILANSAG